VVEGARTRDANTDLPELISFALRIRLLRLLQEAEQQQGAPRIEDLAAGVGTTAVAIRRDLAILRHRGHRIHTRGGH
jgi:DeoR/GlpR family transcriptional regulator of sugar metabolism